MMYVSVSTTGSVSYTHLDVYKRQFPLIPGPNLYYMMYGCVTRDIPLAFSETVILLATCLAIAFGFNIVDVVARSIMNAMKRDYHIGKKS